MRRNSLFKLLSFSLALMVFVAGCNLPQNSGQPTPDITAAYQTVQARLTENAALTPLVTTAVPSATLMASPTTQALTTAAPTVTSLPAAQPTTLVKACDMAGAGNPFDVTIPDGTRMTPGQTFVKTWRLVNTGTCTWTRDYSLALFSGEAMAAQAVQLNADVAPGQAIDLSVSLVAPNTSGTFRGNWKLRNAQGTWFGIGNGGASAFWVEIIVSGTPAAPTVTGTPGTPYPGTTPGSVLSGSAGLQADNTLDLDSGLVNGASADLTFKVNPKGKQSIASVGATTLALMGAATPTLASCKAAAMTSGAAMLDDVGSGTYLCYRTDAGFYGWLRLVSVSESNLLTVQYNTWLNQ